MSTARELITSALRTCRAIGSEDTPSSEESGIGLRHLNLLLEQWDAEGWMPYSDVTTASSLVPAQADYTVGIGGNIDVFRPIQLRNIGINVSGTWQNISMLSANDWYALETIQGQTGRPVWGYLNPSFPLATLSLYPAPDSAYPIKIIAQATVSGVDLDTILQLPPGYEGALEYELASILGPIYHVPDLGDVRAIAMQRKATLKRMRDKAIRLDAGMAPRGRGPGRFDARSMTYL